MTPEEQLYRDAWLAEMWGTVRQYIAPVDPRPRPVDKPVDKGRKRAS